MGQQQKQQEEAPTMMKENLHEAGRQLQLPSSEVQRSSLLPPWNQDGNIEVIALDSDDSTEFRESALGEARSGGRGRYAGRLRKQAPKKCNSDFIFTSEELGFSDDDACRESEKKLVERLRNGKSKRGRKKYRTERWSSACEAREVRSPPIAIQETENRNLPDHGRAKISEEGIRDWVTCQRKECDDSRGALVWESAQLEHEISTSKEKHQGVSLDEGNAIAGCRTVQPGSPPSSVGRIGPSCKPDQSVRGCNMVTQVESFPRELGGLHDGPATPVKPPIRKRKAGVLAEEFPEDHELEALGNRRARSDGAESGVQQQQYYQLSSDGEEGTDRSRGAVTGLYKQTPPPSAIPLFDTLQADQLDSFLNGEYTEGDPRFDNLDALATGAACRPSILGNGSQFLSGRESCHSIPLNELDAYIDSLKACYSQGEGGLFPVTTDRDGFSIASEPSTDESLGTAHSDEDCQLPAACSAFQSKTDILGTPIQTSYPSRSRRSLSFHHDGVTRRVWSICNSLSDVLPPPHGETQPLSNTSDVELVHPIPDDQQQVSVNDAFTEILDVREDLEPDDGNELAEKDVEAREVLLDLNEPPEQQEEHQQKKSKIRKKHRPKVFREGRPYRRRKPKNAEEENPQKKERRPYRRRKPKNADEEILQKKGSEGKKVGEKPRGKKKRVIPDKSNGGDLLEKQGSHSTAADPNSGSGIADCAQCQENQRVPEAERCTTHSGESPQTPVTEYVLVGGPNDSLIPQRDCSLDAGCSPLSTSASASPGLSKDRFGEDNPLIVTDNPVRRSGVRRELFKKARRKRNTGVGEQGLGLGEKAQECVNEATVYSIAKSLEAGQKSFKKARRKKSTAVVEQGLELGEKSQECMNEATVHPTANILEGGQSLAVVEQGLELGEKSQECMNEATVHPTTNISEGGQSLAVVEQGLELGDKSHECMNEATVHPTANILEGGQFVGTDSIDSQELVHLESQERSMGEAMVDPCLISVEVASTVILEGWNPSISEEGVLDKSPIISTEVAIILPIRMREAARAKGRLNLSNEGKKKPPTRRLKKQIDITTTLDQVMKRMANMELNENNLQLVPHVVQQTAMVSYDGPFMPLRRKKTRAKVMLDFEDKRVWRLLMTQGTSFEDNSAKDAPRQWEEERAIMKARAEKFINRMHLVQGDRRFSVWKGSVVDSVVGAFLTQNVSDHLSSSAFMCLASRFPVPRKKKAASECSQEATFTEVQVEESFEFSQKVSELHVSDNIAEAVQEGSRTVFHVEEVLEIGEKSSATGGGSSTCCDQQAHHHLGTKWYNDAEERLTDHVGEEKVSCSKFKDSQSRCDICVHNATSHAAESSVVREIEQQKTFGVVDDSSPLQSGPEDVFLVSSGHSQVTSISSTAGLDGGEKEATQIMARPTPDHWAQTDSELLEGSLIVDLSLAADDLVMQKDQTPQSTCTCLESVCNNPNTPETRGDSVHQEKICSSTLLGLEVTCTSAGEVAASSGSVVSSSDSVDAHKLSLTSVTAGSAVNCANGEEIRAITTGVMFAGDAFDTNNSYDKQLVISSAADTDDHVRRDLSLAIESYNLHDLKSLLRNALRKNVPDVNSKNKSELLTITSDGQEKEVRGRGRRPVLSLTGIDRARLEEANITSKVAFDWEAVRLKYAAGPEMGENQHDSGQTRYKSFRSSNVENGVDWDAVRSANLEDIAYVIKERGMNNVLAGRIKAFLGRVQKEHGSVDLEWLRTVSVEEAKSFLLSIRGLGLKSVECIRLLTLHHLAFPVDTNVGRICVRLGWVPLEPLPEELQLHLLELYPVQETIQKYLWPRLCSLDQRTLYELHYQMITFGKVFCTKSRPNCNACPMRDDCQHFASALASARLALPAAAHEDSHSTSSEPLGLPAAAAAEFVEKAKLALLPPDQDDISGEEGAELSKLNSFIKSQKPCEPIIEEPRTPEPVVVNITDIEDMEQLVGRDEEHETFFGVSSQASGSDKGSSTEVEIVLPPAEVLLPDRALKALVCLPPGSESIPVPKLKNVGRLRTVHYVYELPDNHPLVHEMDPREADDPCVYLLAIWSPGESPQAPPVFDDMYTNGTCDGFESSEEETVKGTVLVPCRTAMRGIFPLNGTYFQVNEVFADHASSLQPIEVPRTVLWNLRRRFVYFGTSVTTIFKGLSTEEIQACFWRGYVCVRGFDCVSRSPKPLAARLHFPASKIIRKTKGQINSDDA